MKKPYPDHSWVCKQIPIIAYTSFGRSGSIWFCSRCGIHMTVAGKQFPTLQNQIDQGVHLNCDVMFVARIMQS